MKKIIIITLITFALSPFNSFAQNSNLTQADLPDNTPTKATSPTATKPNTTNNIDKKSTIIDKSKLLDVGDNVLGHTNDLVNTLLGNNKVTSLMFDDEELSNIERALDSFKNNQAYAPEDNSNSAEAKKEKEKKAKDLEAADENEKSYIYLASIIYYSPKDWALWINNLKITSDSNKNTKELFIKEIYPDHAKIVWSLSVSKWKILSGKKSEDAAPKLNAKNNVEIEFILRPNQTFILGSGRITEGRAVINLVKEKELVKGKEATKTKETPTEKIAK